MPCTICGKDETVHDHHIWWEPEMTIPVCSDCHHRIHHGDLYDYLPPPGDNWRNAYERSRWKNRPSEYMERKRAYWREYTRARRSRIGRDAYNEYQRERYKARRKVI